MGTFAEWLRDNHRRNAALEYETKHQVAQQEIREMHMANRPVAAHPENRPPLAAAATGHYDPSIDIPDPEPGWATRHPDRALAFLYVSPRPCSAIDELMRL
jgi:hypothetical protein